MPYDVVIVGGGPAGLSAALALGRARKRVLICDAGARRNGRATAIHNFVTQDGVSPDAFRDVAQKQLSPYTTVEFRGERVASIAGERDAFRVTLPSGTVDARRVLLCTGMVDAMLDVEGFEELWGHSIFQCPYCHGWEVRDQRWAYLVQNAASAHLLPFALQALGWTSDLVVVTDGTFEVEPNVQDGLAAAEIPLRIGPVQKFVGDDGKLTAIEVSDEVIERDVIFTHPPQRQPKLVDALGIKLDSQGYVEAHAFSGETSTPGIYAAGDLTSRLQSAIVAAAAGVRAAAAMNVDLATSFLPAQSP